MPETSTPPNPTNGLDKEIREFEGSHVVQTPPSLPVAKPDDKPVETPAKVESTTAKPDVKPSPTITDFNKILNTGNDSTLNKIRAKTDETQKTAKTNNTDEPNRGKELGIKTDDSIEERDEKGQKRPERNLEGFSEREALYLKRMPYEAYEHFSKELREAKTLKEAQKANEAKIKALEEGRTVLPESYYDNPNSIYLSPEFNEMQQNVQLAKSVEQHWAEQLIKVKQGEDWEDLENDPKTGNIVIGKTQRYKDVGDEVRITRYLNNAAQQTANLNNEVQQYVGKFQSRVGERQTHISNVEKEMFPGFDDKESDVYKQVEATKAHITEKWGIRPDNPAFNLLAKAVATGIMLRDVLNNMTQKQETKKEIQNDQRRAGPTNNNFNGGGSVKPTIEPPTLDDFNKILNR